MSSGTRQRTAAAAAAAAPPNDQHTLQNNSSVGVGGRGRPLYSSSPDSDSDSYNNSDSDSDSTWVDAALTAFIVLLMLLAVSYLTTHTLHFGILGPASAGSTRLSFGARNTNPNTNTAKTTPAAASSSSNPNPNPDPNPSPGSDGLLPPSITAASLLELEKQGQAKATAKTTETGTESGTGTGTGTDTATDTATTATGADGKPRKRFRKKKPRGSRTFTLSELAAFDGSDPDKPIYIAIKGHVYDVSSGKQYYGKGSGYNIFAGRDCSRAFLTGCFKERYPGHDLRGLTPEQMKEIDNWLKFYQDHETYFYVGELVLPEVTEDTPLPNENCAVYDQPGDYTQYTQTNQNAQTQQQTTTTTDTETSSQDNNRDSTTQNTAIPSETPAVTVPAAA